MNWHISVGYTSNALTPTEGISYDLYTTRVVWGHLDWSRQQVYILVDTYFSINSKFSFRWHHWFSTCFDQKTVFRISTCNRVRGGCMAQWTIKLDRFCWTIYFKSGKSRTWFENNKNFSRKLGWPISRECCNLEKVLRIYSEALFRRNVSRIEISSDLFLSFRYHLLKQDLLFLGVKVSILWYPCDTSGTYKSFAPTTLYHRYWFKLKKVS